MTQHRQSTRTRTSTKRSVRGAEVCDRVGATTARGGGCMIMLPGTHGRAPLCARVVSFSFVPFRLRKRFQGFASYFAFKMNVFGSLSRPPIPLIPPFLFIL